MTKLTSFLLAAAAFAVPFVDANTKVTVIELGKGGVVRRTSSTNSKTTIEGIASFWSALHTSSRRLQHADMPVVPDLFRKAERGVVIGLMGSGVDLDSLPTISRLVSEEGNNGVIGNMEIEGSHCEKLLNEVRNVEAVDAPSFLSSAKKHAAESGLSGMKLIVDNSNAATVDNQVAELLQLLEGGTDTDTVVLHLVVEEEEGASRRRLLARRLEGGEGEGDRNNEEDREGGNNRNNNNNRNGNNNNKKQYNGYYGYGYYNAYGEWVTPYKTMFQIQYFNVVLWTSVGLTVVLFFTVYLMMYMPLMPDTLLFGESAKFVGDD